MKKKFMNLLKTLSRDEMREVTGVMGTIVMTASQMLLLLVMVVDTYPRIYKMSVWTIR